MFVKNPGAGPISMIITTLAAHAYGGEADLYPAVAGILARMPDYAAYVIVGGVAAGVTLIATPLVRLLALRLGWVVQPDERRVHTQPTAAASRATRLITPISSGPAAAAAGGISGSSPTYV
jgi:hypothetical protein